VEDPNPLVSGQGFAYLQRHGVTVEVGLGETLATRLNQPFFTLIRERRPFVIMKAAVSTDGCIAEAPGHRTQLTSAAAERHAHRVRAEVDAIGIGVGTLIIDDPVLTARGAFRVRPLTRVVFDRSLRTPPAARLLSTHEAGPVIIVTTAAGVGRADAHRQLSSRGAEILIAADSTFGAALACLAERGISSLLLEGGALVHQAAWDEGLADFVQLYVTPHTLGSAGLRFLNGRPFMPTALSEVRVETLAPDVLIEGYVHRPR
jgi:diaminohydroxyphosphoribosylaminopyrimidine deaminase/5-amino-6-(5-phosphoribosylamino)uracil reductase